MQKVKVKVVEMGPLNSGVCLGTKFLYSAFLYIIDNAYQCYCIYFVAPNQP